MKFFATFFFAVLFHIANATTFYISTHGDDHEGNGSISSPWKTLHKATVEVTRPGDIIHVLPGTYIETIRCNLAPGVSIEGEGENSVIGSTLAEPYVSIITAASEEGTNGGQSISKLKFDGNNQTTAIAIIITGRSFFSVHDCTIINFEETGVSFSGSASMVTPGAPAKYATGNSFYNNKVMNCAKYDNFGRGCLQFGGQTGMLVYNNYISQTGRGFAKNGWPVKMANEGYIKGCKIYNNKLIKQSYRGDYGGEDGWNFAVELWNIEGLEIYGNEIQGAVDLANCAKGEYAYGVYIHDNTLKQPAMPKKTEEGIILETNQSDVIIKNNKLIYLATGIVFAPHDYSNSGSGIDVNRIIIEDNIFENLGRDGGEDGYGIRWHNTDFNPVTYVSDITIQRNRFIALPSVNAAGTGIQLPSYKGPVVSKNIRIIDNLIQGFRFSAVSANPGVNVDSIIFTGNQIYNNGNHNEPLFTGGVPETIIEANNKKGNLKSVPVPAFSFREQVIKPFYHDLKNSSVLELIAVIAGILSVWFSKKENIYVYPVGLVNTVIYVFLSFDASLFGEASVNLYYTVMSIYGWIIWSKRDKRKHRIVRVTASSKKEWITALAFFGVFYIVIFAALTFLKNSFSSGTIPWADAFASATAFTGMWLMTKKKVESWYWWIATNIASIPLYFVKHFVLTSGYYCILLVLAFMGLQEWKKRSKTTKRK